MCTRYMGPVHYGIHMTLHRGVVCAVHEKGLGETVEELAATHVYMCMYMHIHIHTHVHIGRCTLM